MYILLRRSPGLYRCFCSQPSERMNSIAEDLFKGRLSTRILSYPVSDTPTDVEFAKLRVNTPTSSDIREWSSYHVMENSGLWEKLNISPSVNGDHNLFLSGYLGPRPLILSGMDAPQGEWAHCKSAALNRHNALNYKVTNTNQKLIHGTEEFVLNASKAENFVVWATHENSEEVLAFLVPKTSTGLEVEDIPEYTTISSLEGRKVKFNNVVGVEIGEGNSLFRNTISKEHRIYISARILGKLIKLFNVTLKHTQEKQKFGRSFFEINVIQNRLSKISAQIYALQSSLYLVSGLADSNPIDFELDSTLLQILSESVTSSVVQECASILGVSRLFEGSLYEDIFKDIEFTFLNLDMPIDVTKCYASLLGIQGPGKEVGDLIKLRRTAVSHPVAAFKDIFNRHLNYRSRIKKRKSLGLAGYVNAQFEDSTNSLEDYILDFRYLIESSLQIYGRNIQLEEGELSRMAEYASELLAIVSIISRLNLISAQPGGYRKDYEKCLGYAYMRQAFIKLQFLTKEIGLQNLATNDKNLRDLGDYIFDQAKYPYIHPITKNRF